MDAGLKQRLIGAAVLVALAVIFLPMLVKGPAPDSGVSDLSMRVPDAPQDGYRTVDLPLVVPPEAPSGGVLPVPEATMPDGSLPVVDTATASPDGDIAPDDQPEAGSPAAETPAEASPEAATPSTPAQEQAPPAAAAATRLPPTVAGGDYAVHFGAFSSERDAQLIVRQLAGAGLTAYAEPFELNGRPAQRVRLGPYASREAAEAVRVRAAQVRDDVTPRVVALDAAEPAPSRVAQTAAPAPAATSASTAATRPAPTAPAAESAPALAASGVGYAVQVGAFSNAADATRLRDRLRGLGITAFTDTVDTDKGRLTRVKAGPVPSREEAERLKSQLKARAGIGDGLVRPHP